MTTELAYIHEQLIANSIPVVGVRRLQDSSIEIDYDGSETEQDIINAENIRDTSIVEYANIQTEKQQRESDKQSILDLAATAKNYSGEVAAIMNAVVNADYGISDTDTRFAAIRAAVAAQGTGFKNALHAALESDTGLNTIVLDLTPTSIQKQQYNHWTRNFALTWSIMILLG